MKLLHFKEKFLKSFLLAVFCLVLITVLLGGAKKKEKEPDGLSTLFAHLPSKNLKVVRVIDDDFEKITDEDLYVMIDSAKYMLADKLGIRNVSFGGVETLTIEEFFEKYLKKDNKVYSTKNERRFRVGEKNDFEKHKKSIINYLKKWKVEEIQGFFPKNERSRYDSYEKIYNGIVTQMRAKIDQISKIKVNGKSILRPGKATYRSFMNWLAVLENQDEYDFVLTNTFILFDDISQPQPHGIFHKCKVGGVSTGNTHRHTLEDRVIMTSTFGMDTNIPFFMERKDEKFSRKDRNEVIGGFIIAHELGHAIIKLPDQYSHPPECLMNNNKEITYKEGYELLKKNAGPCPVCRKWLDARSLFYDAEWYFSKKQWRKAVELYMQVIKSTPKNVDGSYRGYMAFLAFKMSKAYFELGNLEMALKGAEKAVSLYRWKEEYETWRKELASEIGKKILKKIP